MTRTTEQKTKAWEDVDKARARFINEYETAFLAALNAQIAPVIVAVKRGKEKPENYLVELPISEVLSDLYKKVGLVFAVQEYRAVMRLKYGNIDYQTKAEEPESQWLRFVRGWLGTKGAEKVKQITDTTRDFVKKVLDIGVKEGLGTDAVADLMIDKAKGINKTRAKIIARTEIIGSSNLGSLEGAISTGLSLEKEWGATPQPKRTRDWHLAADGQTRPLKEAFLVNGEKLQYPGDPAGSGSNIIQCRCSILYNPL